MDRKSKMWVGFCVFALVIFGSSFLGYVQAAEKVMNLTTHDPAMSRGYTKAWEWWSREVEKQTNGEIMIKHLWGGVLGPAKEAVDSLKNGVYDMSMVTPTYVPKQLPLWTVFEVPFVTSSMWAFGMTMWDMKDEPALKKEIERWRVKVLIPIMPSSFEFMSRKPLRNLADFKGLKTRCYGMFADVINQFGAHSVSIASAELYENMQRGVVDAGILPWPDFFVSYRVNELCKYGLITPGFGYIANPFCISMDTWDKISPKNQQIMLSLCRAAVDKNIEITRELAAPALALFKKQGIEVNTLSKAERDKMVDAARKSWEGWIKEQEKDGHKEARMILEKVVKKAKEYEAKDPYK